tara:strand:- start:5 stop:481 length:477 start_codon:yes stop_codon:yes gene_type:complete
MQDLNYTTHKVEIVPFRNEHAEFILSQELNASELYLKPEHRKYALYLEQVGLSFTGLVNNKPIAAGGISLLWDGVAEGWVMATKDIWKHYIVFAKHFKKKTDVLIETTNLKRLQTTVKADFKKGHRFAEWLGMKSEGIMKNYGPDGSDYIRYARIIKR